MLSNDKTIMNESNCSNFSKLFAMKCKDAFCSATITTRNFRRADADLSFLLNFITQTHVLPYKLAILDKNLDIM